MAEALAAVGLASAIVQFIDFGTRVVVRLSEFSTEAKEVPKIFRQIKVQLPLILNTLQQTKDQAEARHVNEDTAKALKAVVGECTTIVQQLDEILTKTLPNDEASTWQKYRKALSSLAQDKKIAQLQASIEGYIPLLNYHQTLVISSSFKDLSIHPTTESTDTDLPQPNRKPCFMVHFEQDPNFVGREDELREIEERFKAQHRVVLSGIGGVGYVMPLNALRLLTPAVWTPLCIVLFATKCDLSTFSSINLPLATKSISQFMLHSLGRNVAHGIL